MTRRMILVALIGAFAAAVLAAGSSQASTTLVTTATLDPAPNSAGWLRGDVRATLTAHRTDAVTWYAIDDAGCAPTNSDTSHGCRSTADDLLRPFLISGEGRHTLYFFSEDGAGNLEALQTLPVWIDSTPPQIMAPPNVTAEATFQGGTVVHPGAATAQDDLSGIATVSDFPAAPYSLGTTAVQFTATDVAGNSSTATNLVTVIDTTAPVLIPPPDVTAYTQDAAGTALPSEVLGIPTASDVASSVTIFGGFPAGYVFPVGDTVVTFEARDASGNTAIATQRVTVRLDITPPQLNLPAAISTSATGSNGALVSYVASATDNVDPNPTVVCDRASGTLFSVGATTVLCTARDAAGNDASGSFTVTVKGAAEQLTDIRAAVQSLNLTQGIANSLDAKLANLEQAITSNRNGDRVSACNKLDAFVNEVNAQVQAGRLTSTQAAPLITAANRVKAVLGCA